MQKASQKAEYNRIKNDIIKRAGTEEEKILTDKISLELFGKKIGDEQWKIGGRKKTN